MNIENSDRLCKLFLPSAFCTLFAKLKKYSAVDDRHFSWAILHNRRWEALFFCLAQHEYQRATEEFVIRSGLESTQKMLK